MSKELNKPFELIASQNLTKCQLKLAADAMRWSVEIHPEDSQTRAIWMQGALRVVVDVKQPDIENENQSLRQ